MTKKTFFIYYYVDTDITYRKKLNYRNNIKLYFWYKRYYDFESSDYDYCGTYGGAIG